MKFTYACKKVSLNDSIKEYAEKKISKLQRYFHDEDAAASVTFSVEKNHLCTAEITIRVAAPSSVPRLRRRMGICAAPLTLPWVILSARS